MLSGKNVLITGASRGIGKAIVLLFAKNGAFVGINYNRSKEQAKKVLEEVKELSGKGILLHADVSSMTDVEKMIIKFVKIAKYIDILVLNAGIYIRRSFIELSEEQWKKTLSINLDGCYNVCKASLPYLRDGGSIIFISSQLAFKGSDHGADYVTSKAGILGLMKSLAIELASRNIRVNAIAPGIIDTDIIASYTEEMRRKRAEEIPLHRLGKPEDIANVCLFLASDLSGYITGEVIHVNGGFYIH